MQNGRINAYIMIISWISSWLFEVLSIAQQYFFTHHLLFSREKPLVKPTAPGSLSHIICLLFSDLLNQKYKNTLLQFMLFGVQSINIYNFLTFVCLSWVPLPERDWQPLLHVGLRVFVICVQVMFMLCCLVLLLVQYLGLITEGNTLPSLCYIIPPSPGKYRRSSSCHHVLFNSF